MQVTIENVTTIVIKSKLHIQNSHELFVFGFEILPNYGKWNFEPELAQAARSKSRSKSM